MQNIDMSTIITYKNKIINGVIILIAAIIGYNLYAGQSKGIEQLNANKEIELKKNSVLSNLNNLENKAATYKKLANSKDINSIMNAVGNIANMANTKVDSFKPTQEKVFPVYTKYTYLVKVSCADYLTLGKFVSALENSPEVFTVETLDIAPTTLSTEEENLGETAGLVAEMTISTILFK